MNFFRIVLASLALSGAFSVHAIEEKSSDTVEKKSTPVVSVKQRGDFYAGFSLGNGNFEVAPEYTVNNSGVDSSGLIFEGLFGYRWKSKFFVEGHLSVVSDDVFLVDELFSIFGGENVDTSITTTTIYGGYTFDINKHFRISPMLGYTRWELESKVDVENPRADQVVKTKGNDLKYRLNFDFPVGKLVVLNLAYERASYNFGKTDNTYFGIKFEW